MLNAVMGPYGSGKTLFAVTKAWEYWRTHPQGVIYTNTPLYFPAHADGSVPMLYHGREGLASLYEARDAFILGDELHLLFPSRSWSKTGTSDAFFEWISQPRKNDIQIWYTCQTDAVDSLIRQLTRATYWVESWRRLGFFTYRRFALYGKNNSMEEPGGWYPLNRKVASMYDTKYKVRIKGYSTN